jgi:hypothetical protein
MVRVDLTGQRFGRWFVEAKDPNPTRTSRHVFWLVVCDCGQEGSVRTGDLLTGHSKGCRECYLAQPCRK